MIISKKIASEEYVDAAVANAGGSSTFIINITGNDTDGYTADKTFDEIVESHKSGKILTCISSEGLICDLTVIDEGYGAIFVNYAMILDNGALLPSYIVFIQSDSSVIEEKVRFDTGDTDLLATTDKTIVGAINELNSTKANVQIITWEADD